MHKNKNKIESKTAGMYGRLVNKVMFKTANIFVKRTGTKVIRCSFPFNPTYIKEIKKFPGKQWSASNKSWYIPLSLDNCFELQKLKYRFSKELKDWANNEWKRKNKPVKIDIIPGLKKLLRGFQKTGVTEIERRNGRVLLADDMGLGKTIQVLAWLQLRKELRPAVVICPAFGKYNWAEEIQEWMTEQQIQILSGQAPENIKYSDIVIINYDIVDYWKLELIDFHPKVLIIDEAHYIKNDSAKRTKATKKIGRHCEHILGLTGTPIENRTSELYSIVNLINPSLFPVKLTFLHEYCGAKHNGFGWTFDGATKSKELNKKLTDTIMIRRKKEDVLSELPDKTYTFVPLDIKNRTKYQKAENNFRRYLRTKTVTDLKREIKQHFNEDHPITLDKKETRKLQRKNADKANPLSQMAALKQLAIKGKIHGCIDWIKNFLDCGRKLVVFCEHRWTIETIYEEFGRIAVTIDGSLSSKQKHETVKRFQTNNKIKLVICNKAAEEMITLTAASDIAHVEYPRTPGKLAQRNDRIHRIGQKNACNIWYLMALDTIDMKEAKRLDEKARLISQVMDGKDIEDENLFEYIINEYTKE